MSDVKWIKITTDIFDDDAFQIIDGLPEADAIELIWFKLLVFAGKQNNHGLFVFKDSIAYTDEMLASIFHRPLNVVRLALSTFMNLGMIEQIDGVYAIPNWEKHQNLDSYEMKKERDRKAAQTYRAKQRQMLLEMQENESGSDDNSKISADVSADVRRFCSYSYSISNNTEIDKDINKYIDTVIAYLNEKTGKHFSKKTEATRKAIHARITDGYTVDDFKKVIDIKCADWLDDEKMNKFLAPDTLFRPSNFEKYLNQQPKKVRADVYADQFTGYDDTKLFDET